MELVYNFGKAIDIAKSDVKKNFIPKHRHATNRKKKSIEKGTDLWAI